VGTSFAKSISLDESVAFSVRLLRCAPCHGVLSSQLPIVLFTLYKQYSVECVRLMLYPTTTVQGVEPALMMSKRFARANKPRGTVT